MNKKTEKEREALEDDFLCGRQKENNISRIRSCLLHVWLVALSDFLLQFRLFFQKKQLLRALHEFLKY